jgi:nicotinamidase-related amidase
MNALLVIDMQNDCFDLAKRFDKDGTISRINTLIDLFREKGGKIIFIQHDGTAENYMFPNTHGWQIVDALNKKDSDIYVGKTANDAFYGTELDRMIRDANVDTLYCTGLATDFCFNATVQSALTRDYAVRVVGDCHTTADRPMLGAEKIIAYFNWLWANMTPTRGRIEVVGSEDVSRLF